MNLSIIVPIYNVEKYIKTCLYSILSEISNRNDVELILIDDGSPDHSVDIAKDIIRNCEHVNLYHQDNQGLSMARNNGVTHANGRYIWFIDSDDSIAPNSVEVILNIINNYSPDLIQIDYQWVYEDNRNPIVFHSKFSGLLSGKYVISHGSLPAPAQFTIYNKCFLEDNSLKFKAGILHEDSEFKPRVTYLAKTIYFSKIVAYNYLQRTSGNIMSSFSLKNAYDICALNNSLIQFNHIYVKEKDCKIGIRKLIGMNLNTLLDGIVHLNKQDYNHSLSLLKKNTQVFKEIIKSLNLKYFIEGILLYISPSLSIYLYKFFKSFGRGK